MGHHQSYASQVSDYLDASNGGDIDRVAAVLKQKGHYTAPQTSYAPDNARDIVDFREGSVPIRGRVQDRAGGDGALAVATASQVLLIDAATRKAEAVSGQGADAMALSASWIAWARDGQIFARRR